MTRIHFRALCLAAILVATSAVTAHAQPPSGGENPGPPARPPSPKPGPAAAQAEALFQRGQRLMTERKFAQACAAFDESQKLDPTISTLLNQAHCREKNGQLATAWSHFLQAERETRDASDAATQKLHKVAQERAAKLEPRVSKLKIIVSAKNRINGLEISRNGERVTDATWNVALPVDGGSYAITARAPGVPEWSTTVTIDQAGDLETVKVPRLSGSEAGPNPIPTPTETPTPTPIQGDEAGPAPRTESHMLLPIVIGAGSVALFGTAVGFELWGRARYSDAEVEPDDARQESLWQSANSKRHIALGLAGAAIVTGGLAGWLYWRSGRTREPHPRSASEVGVVPVVGASEIGVVVSGGW